MFIAFIKMVDNKDLLSSIYLILISTLLIVFGMPGTIYAIMMGYLMDDLWIAFVISNISKITGMCI